MPSKNNLKPNYKQQLKEMRSFIDFDYDLRKPLSSRAKGKINRYHEEFSQLTARPHQIYRARKKDRLQKAQEFAQHEGDLRGFTVAFIPTNGNEKRKIKYGKDGEIRAESEHVTTRVLNIDPHRLGAGDENTEAYIAGLIKQAPNARSFTVLAGAFEIPQGQSRRSLPRYIARLVDQYTKPDKIKDHNPMQWLHGVAAHSYKNQDDFLDYQTEKQRNKRELQRKRKNKKKAEKRAK